MVFTCFIEAVAPSPPRVFAPEVVMAAPAGGAAEEQGFHRKWI